MYFRIFYAFGTVYIKKTKRKAGKSCRTFSHCAIIPTKFIKFSDFPHWLSCQNIPQDPLKLPNTTTLPNPNHN